MCWWILAESIAHFSWHNSNAFIKGELPFSWDVSTTYKSRPVMFHPPPPKEKGVSSLYSSNRPQYRIRTKTKHSPSPQPTIPLEQAKRSDNTPPYGCIPRKRDQPDQPRGSCTGWVRAKGQLPSGSSIEPQQDDPIKDISYPTPVYNHLCSLVLYSSFVALSSHHGSVIKPTHIILCRSHGRLTHEQKGSLTYTKELHIVE